MSHRRARNGDNHLMTDARSVLIVDDEKLLADLLAQALAREGWSTRTAVNGMEALHAVRSRRPDVVVLDVMMPVMDGVETLARIRAEDPHLPVLMLTAKDALADRVGALRSGADDYVTKPFDLDEVSARLEALVRRAGLTVAETDDEEVYTVGDLTLNATRHTVTRGDTAIDLTPTEFDLCRFLMINAERVVSKHQILDGVWHYDFGGRANIVELYVSYLRRKLDAHGPGLIHTIRGVGYVLRADA